ncbi:hypothetical protein RchiOBHm_Chr5g0032371 [Rosa chinensis]|uniref:Secreted protein n=1 Tax=Rosa chinensis TaxID=74649 RepID=A0A2P6QAD9_ROSCH|nr:hypothetical protein RchiOBHm_Chr5g0032371 [Rosa chinensis]
MCLIKLFTLSLLLLIQPWNQFYLTIYLASLDRSVQDRSASNCNLYSFDVPDQIVYLIFTTIDTTMESVLFNHIFGFFGSFCTRSS